MVLSRSFRSGRTQFHHDRAFGLRRRRMGRNFLGRRRRGNRLVRKVARIAAVQRLRAPEKKVAYANVGLTGVAAISLAIAGAPLLPTIAQGVTAVQRIGDKVTITSMNMRFEFFSSGGVPEGQLIRIIVIQQKSIPGATAVVPDLIDVLAVDHIRSPLLLPTFRRGFNVIADRSFDMKPGGHAYVPSSDALTTARFARRGTINLHLRQKVLQFTNSTGDVVVNGEIYWWILANNDLALPTYNMIMTTRWIDS